MKSKFVKRILATTLAAGVFVSANVNVVHATAYPIGGVVIWADKSVKGDDSKGYYATGWVECAPSHYTTTKLENTKTGTYVKTSERKKGKGKVSASTGRTTKYAKSALRARVFYDWA